MNEELVELDQTLVTKIALARSLFCVYPHVPVQLSRKFESSVTDRARVWMLLSVETKMDRQAGSLPPSYFCDKCEASPLYVSTSVWPVRPPWRNFCHSRYICRVLRGSRSPSIIGVNIMNMYITARGLVMCNLMLFEIALQ